MLNTALLFISRIRYYAGGNKYRRMGLWWMTVIPVLVILVYVFGRISPTPQMAQYIEHDSQGVEVVARGTPLHPKCSPGGAYRKSGDRVFFVSYASGRFVWSQNLTNSEAVGLHVFDEVCAFGPEDIPADFAWRNAGTLELARGGGFWLWKPLIMKILLDRMAPGDVIMYADAGCEWVGSPTIYFPLARSYGFLGHRLAHQMRKYTKMNVFVAMEMDPTIFGVQMQIMATSFLLQKRPKVVAFVDEWLSLAENPLLLTDASSIIPNDPVFFDHRHDQAIFSLLVYKRSMSLVIEDETWPRKNSRALYAVRRSLPSPLVVVSSPTSSVARAFPPPHVVAPFQDASLFSHEIISWQNMAIINARMAANARRKHQERAAWLSPPHSEWKEFSSLRLDSSPAWYIFSPVYPCPGTMEKVPGAAEQHDGGKWICGLQEMANAPAPCNVYSFGSNNNFMFEDRVHSLVPHCVVHTFDPTSAAPPSEAPTASFLHFHGDYGINGTSGPATVERPFAVASLRDIMRSLNHTFLDVLKIDVEGSEWSVILDTDWSSLQVGQLLIELHPQLGGGPTTAGALEPYFHKLEEAGFFLASIEPVTYTNFGQVEVSFIHEGWIPGKGFVKLKG